ncbi:MAG: rhomboid family intramembrane serine protease [Desulfobacterales bacterium]|nr:rhomboid family intramembrane serine protease [Desulfobacterales bacterium]
MIIIFPLRHESGEVRRYPYITIGIVAICLFLSVITYFVEPDDTKLLAKRQSELFSYYVAYSIHSPLYLPEETFDKLDSGMQNHIKKMKRNGLIMERPQGAESDASDQPAESEEYTTEYEEEAVVYDDETPDAQNEQMEAFMREFGGKSGMKQEEWGQKKLDRLVKEFEEAYKNHFFMKHGYIPAEGGFFSLVSCMFLHAGFFHLFFNMVLLWMTGCNIEDLWGRIIYPIFYVVGGIVATMAHVVMFPESTQPLVGASGAIAAVMGAFMIRLYNTRINFMYIIGAGIRVKRGTFIAPAYLMLPLWLADQLFEAYLASYMGGSVAFWAHIGGFIFGAVVALAIKFSGIEEKYINPAIEKKTNLVDEDYSSGMKKLDEDDPDGAVQDLRKALVNDPDNSDARIGLSKAYFRQEKTKVAVLEFNRGIKSYIKQDCADIAADEYLEMISEFPDATLDSLLQLKLAKAMEEKEMYSEAASAYKNITPLFQDKPEFRNNPDTATALTRYGDICLRHLDNPQEAIKAFKMIVKVCPKISPELQKEIRAKAQEAMSIIQQEKKKAEVLMQIQEPEELKQKPKAPPAKPAIKKPGIPLQKRIKLVQEPQTHGKYKVMSAAPFPINKITPVEEGIDLNRASDPPLLYNNITFICVFQLERDENTAVSADLFITGKQRPYRLTANRILFTEFLDDCSSSSADNFRKFILNMISYIDCVFLDQKTMNFLKTGKAHLISGQSDIEIYERKFWSCLMGEARFQCEKCLEVYWIDNSKIPETGARTKCKKCGNPVPVRRK